MKLKPKASCSTPVNHWNERPIQRCNTTLLVVKNLLELPQLHLWLSWEYHCCEIYRIRNCPQILLSEECKHFTRMALVCQTGEGREIDEGTNYSWKSQKEQRTFKDFIKKWGAREWVSPNFKRLNPQTAGLVGRAGFFQLETGLLLCCNPDISLVD